MLVTANSDEIFKYLCVQLKSVHQKSRSRHHNSWIKVEKYLSSPRAQRNILERTSRRHKCCNPNEYGVKGIHEIRGGGSRKYFTRDFWRILFFRWREQQSRKIKREKLTSVKCFCTEKILVSAREAKNFWVPYAYEFDGNSTACTRRIWNIKECGWE